MSDPAPAWVVPAMRLGYGGRGVVYTVVGVLAFLAAWSGGNAEGTTGALTQLRDQAWGVAVLIAIAIGMFAYAIWRGIDSLMDLEDYGSDAKGLVARIGMVVTGLIHLALGVWVVGMLIGSGGSGGEGAESLTAQVMQKSWGRYAIGIAAACVIGAGIYYMVKGYTRSYRKHLRLTQMTERLTPVMRGGLYAYGFVIALIGLFLLWAAWTYDASQAGGLDQAFSTIRAAPFGRILLGVVALGLVGFAVFNFVNAVYRVVPRRAGDDVATLASKAQSQMRQAKARAETAMR